MLLYISFYVSLKILLANQLYSAGKYGTDSISKRCILIGNLNLRARDIIVDKNPSDYLEELLKIHLGLIKKKGVSNEEYTI